MAFSIRDVAKRAGVSPATVSRIMNQTANVSPEKVEAVREAMEYYQYQPNHFGRALVKQRSGMIGVSLAAYNKDTNMSALDTLYMLELLKGVEKALVDTDYHIVLVNNNCRDASGQGASYWDLLQQHRIDGLIFSGMDKELEQQLRKHQQEEPLPIVYMGKRCSGVGGNVYAQYQLYTKEMLLKAYEQGHRKVLLYHAPHQMPIVQQVCRELEQEAPELTVYFQTHIQEPRTALEQLMRDIKKYVKTNGCTAICGMGTEFGMVLLKACAKMGIQVPQDLSLIMVEHKKDSGDQFATPLSAYYVPAREMGTAAAEVLMRLIEGNMESCSNESREFITRYYDRGSLVPPAQQK